MTHGNSPQTQVIHFSMLRSYHLADLLTLANAFVRCSSFHGSCLSLLRAKSIPKKRQNPETQRCAYAHRNPVPVSFAFSSAC